MSYRFENVAGIAGWTMHCGSWLPRILRAVATTLFHSSYVIEGICPDTEAIGHEGWHVEHTNTIRYAWSASVGRLWGDRYWRDQETAANVAGKAAWDNLNYRQAAAAIRAVLPESWPTDKISHSV